MALGRSKRCSLFLVAALIVNSINLAFASPSHKLCVDLACKDKLGVGVTLQNYNPGDESRIAVPSNAEVHVYADFEDLWEVEFEGKRGFVPKSAIKIQKQTVRKESWVKVQLQEEIDGISTSTNAEIYGTTTATGQPVATPLAVPAENSCLLSGTTMYGDMCNDPDATPLSPSTSRLVDLLDAATTEKPVPTTASSWQGVQTVSPGLAVPSRDSEFAGGEVTNSANVFEQFDNGAQFGNSTAGDVADNLVVGNQIAESQPGLQTKSEAESDVKTEPEEQVRSSDGSAGKVQSDPQEQPQLGAQSELREQTESEELSKTEEAAGVGGDTKKDSDEQGQEEVEAEDAKPIPGEAEEEDMESETEDSTEAEGLEASSVGIEDGKEKDVSGSVSGEMESNLTSTRNDQLETGANDPPKEMSSFLAPLNETAEPLGATAVSPSPTVSVTSAEPKPSTLDSSQFEAVVSDVVAVPEKAPPESLDTSPLSPSNAVPAAPDSTLLQDSEKPAFEPNTIMGLLKDVSAGPTALFGSYSLPSMEESQRDTYTSEVFESTEATTQESTLHSDASGEGHEPAVSGESSFTGTLEQSSYILNAFLESSAALGEVHPQSSVTAGKEGASQKAPSDIPWESTSILPSGQRDPASESNPGLVGSVTDNVVSSVIEDVTSIQSSLSQASVATTSSVGESHTVTPQRRVLLQDPGSQPAPFILGSSSPISTHTKEVSPEKPGPLSEQSIVLPSSSEEHAASLIPSTTSGSLPPVVSAPESSSPGLSALESPALGSSASESSGLGTHSLDSPGPDSPALDSPVPVSSSPDSFATESSAIESSAAELSATESSVPEVAALKASAPETGAPGSLRDGSSTENLSVEAQEDQKPALDLYWAMAREYFFWMLALVPEPLQAALEGVLPASSPQPGALIQILVCGLLGFGLLIFYMRTCYVHRRKESSLTGTISSLEQKLFTLVTEKQVLTEQLEHTRSQAEAARSELQEREQRVKCLQEEGEELELCRRERDKALSELRATLSERTEQLEASQQLLAQKERQVSDLEADAAWHRENEASLEEKLREATEERLLWEEKAEEARESEKLLEVRLSEASQTGDHLWKELEALKQREKSLSADLEASVEEAARTARSLSEKDAELQAILKTVEQVQILQNQWESQDDKTEVEERLKELMDLAQVRQDREQAREIQQELEARVLAQNKDLEERAAELASLRAELAESMRARDEAQSQSAAAVTKLEVLSSYFKERELKLQREIGVQEVQRQQKEADAGSATQRVAMLEQQSASYRSQLTSLKQEMEVSERNYKNQLSEQEKRAHENWLAARAAERKLEDANRETANLRQRLTLLEREQLMTNFGPLPPPPGGKEHILGDTMPEGLNPGMPLGLLPPPPPMGAGGPPPMHPMMGPPMFPPFPPPPPELLKRLRPSPGSFREDSPSPRSRDSRGSPPPLPHFLDPRGGPPFLPRPPRSHQTSSTGSGDGRSHRYSPQPSDSRRNGTGSNPSTAV